MSPAVAVNQHDGGSLSWRSVVAIVVDQVCVPTSQGAARGLPLFLTRG
jgi:hypothetical protein